jgi:hypothetical protein
VNVLCHYYGYHPGEDAVRQNSAIPFMGVYRTYGEVCLSPSFCYTVGISALAHFPAPAPLLLGLAQARGSTSAPVLLTPAHPADRTVAEPRPSLLRIYQLLTPGPKQRAKIVIMTCAPQAFVLSTRKFLFSLSVFA